MEQNALIIHGKPRRETYYSAEGKSASNSLWIPWLQQQLVIRDIPTQTPEMPNAWRPDYKVWSREFERFDLRQNTLLIGHSCGAGFLVQWLSEHKDIQVGHVFLVAPWLGVSGMESLPEHDETLHGFFEFTIDSRLSERAKSITLFHSDDDFDSIGQAVRSIRKAIPDINYREFHKYGHFRSKDLGGDVFPELMEEIELML